MDAFDFYPDPKRIGPVIAISFALTLSFHGLLRVPRAWSRLPLRKRLHSIGLLVAPIACILHILLQCHRYQLHETLIVTLQPPSFNAGTIFLVFLAQASEWTAYSMDIIEVGLTTYLSVQSLKRTNTLVRGAAMRKGKPAPLDTGDDKQRKKNGGGANQIGILSTGLIVSALLLACYATVSNTVFFYLQQWPAIIEKNYLNEHNLQPIGRHTAISAYSLISCVDLFMISTLFPLVFMLIILPLRPVCSLKRLSESLFLLRSYSIATCMFFAFVVPSALFLLEKSVVAEGYMHGAGLLFHYLVQVLTENVVLGFEKKAADGQIFHDEIVQGISRYQEATPKKEKIEDSRPEQRRDVEQPASPVRKNVHTWRGDLNGDDEFVLKSPVKISIGEQQDDQGSASPIRKVNTK
ncbi:MAG: hypothetical protein SGCHY_003178 [Lobulomycetales sp.]